MAHEPIIKPITSWFRDELMIACKNYPILNSTLKSLNIRWNFTSDSTACIRHAKRLKKRRLSFLRWTNLAATKHIHRWWDRRAPTGYRYPS